MDMLLIESALINLCCFKSPWSDFPSELVLMGNLHFDFCSERSDNNKAGDAAHTVVSWQWQMIHTSDLMMKKYSVQIFSVIKLGIGKLETHSPIWCIETNWDNGLNLRHIFDNIYLSSTLSISNDTLVVWIAPSQPQLQASFQPN